jgi:hypothetical protein
MNPSIFLSICSAIRNRQVIRLTYGGEPREVEPYCYGISTTGKEVLRGFQIAGTGRSMRSTGWRLFDLAKVQSLEILPTRFPGTRSEYNPADRQMIQQFCCL